MVSLDGEMQVSRAASVLHVLFMCFEMFMDVCSLICADKEF